ncbi:MAG: mannose-1-phosphate guanylyltransferase [Chitinophagales bacterium]|nr:MAG: mannose-1-phosphate guanylyltransferase [Chitinophagales bacterium]
MNDNQDHYVAIMAGGVGSRFWPKSRAALPKQFLDILGTGQTLLQLTYERFKPIVPQENIYVVTHEQYADLVRQQLPELKESQVLSEPQRKNTAPCIAYVAFKIKKLNPYASMVVSPSDHLVLKADVFAQTVSRALHFADESSALITLGIVPTRPDTGYGYIQYIDNHRSGDIFKVKTFTEKPNLELAKSFIKSGDFLWNSGVFIWNVRTILAAFKKNLPEIYEAFEEGAEKLNTPEEKPYITHAYSLCKSISVDFGIMEKAENVFVIPADIGWTDLGTWQSLYELSPKDARANAIQGQHVLLFDTDNSLIIAPENKLVVLQGLDGYFVIDTADALLVCKNDQEQKIKDIIATVKKEHGEKFL